MLGAIHTVTTTATNLDLIEETYGTHLRYKTVSRFTVSDDLAQSWGAPASAGRPCLVMQPESEEQNYLRFVEGDPVPEYKTLRSYGWSSTEIIAEDIYALAAELEKTDLFEIYQPPAVLDFDFTDAISAFQAIGPAQELLYFTTVAEPVPGLDLPQPKCFVGGTFVTILGGRTLESLTNFYCNTFDLTASPPMDGNIRVINKAYERPAGTKTTIATVALPGSTLIELDHFPENAIERPCHPGCLPPGMAMVSFRHENLDAVKTSFLSEPAIRQEAPYNGARSATLKGPVNELIELIEI